MTGNVSFFTNSLIMWQQIINKNGGVSIWRSLVQYYYFGGGVYVIVYGISNSFNGRGKCSRCLIFKFLKLWIEVHISWGVQDVKTKCLPTLAIARCVTWRYIRLFQSLAFVPCEFVDHNISFLIFYFLPCV